MVTLRLADGATGRWPAHAASRLAHLERGALVGCRPRAAERRGELLSAFDLAEHGLEEHPAELALQYHAVLSLARTGSTFQARRRFIQFDLSSVDTEDVAALEARIKKDEALAATGAEREQLAALAAISYRVIRDRTGGYFPAINAATLALVAGDDFSARPGPRRARPGGRRQRRVVLCRGHRGGGTPPSRRRAWRSGVARTSGRPPHGGLRSVVEATRRQLRLICAVSGIDPAILSALAGPSVAHFCGHQMAAPGKKGRLFSEQEDEVTSRIAAVVDRRPVGDRYGSLASGGDILWAEALLAGVNANSASSCPSPWKSLSPPRWPLPAGDGWRDSSVVWRRRPASTTRPSMRTSTMMCSSPTARSWLWDWPSLKARRLDSDVQQLALWDGEAPAGVAGTAADVARWRMTGHDVVVVAPGEPIPARRPVRHRR